MYRTDKTDKSNKSDKNDSDILNEHEILRRIKNLNLDYDVIYKKSTDSTNSDAKKYAGERNLLIAAGEQTAGKGRYGRNFSSQSGKGIYFSLKINNPATEDLTFFPLIAAVAASNAISSLCGIEPAVKWPNDLLYKLPPSHADDTPLKEGGMDGYKKLCGILTEASVSAEPESRNASYVIVGIGLNVGNDISDFPDEIKNTATSLKIISGRQYNRADILCETASEFTRILYIPRNQLLEEYKKRLLTDIDISFKQNGRQFKGRAAGITDGGNLIAKLESGGETVIRSGEINFIHNQD